jgi:ATP-dependent RNA helicase RhlE
VTFDELNLKKPYLNALADLDYVYPTPIQEKAFPVVMSGQNMVGIAQTGTGKTFAYLLPLLSNLSYSEQREPRILILAPTRVLVVQIVNEVKKLAKYTSTRVVGVYGDANINTQKQEVYNGVDVLVATPGRLIDITLSGVLRLKQIQKLVIDEVDEMLSLGLRTQLHNVIELLPTKRQTLMFSATYSPDIEAFMNEYVPNPKKVKVDEHGTPIEKIVQQAYMVPNFTTKTSLLEMLLSNDTDLEKVLVFVATKKQADRLFEQVTKFLPDNVGVIHSNKAHNTRLSALRNFQEGTYRVLISTDIVARGMDIIDVSHVVNFDMPDVASDYIHRIGRTGRAKKDGVAISFVNQVEQQFFVEIEDLMSMNIPVISLPEGLKISNIFSDDEKPKKPVDKNYLKIKTPKSTQGAFHEKKEKNKKVNIGGPKKRNEYNEKARKAGSSKKPNRLRF